MGIHSIMLAGPARLSTLIFYFFLVRLIGCGQKHFEKVGCLKVCETSEVYDQAVSCTHDKLNGVLKTQLVG